jgi:hypothetical protein
MQGLRILAAGLVACCGLWPFLPSISPVFNGFHSLPQGHWLTRYPLVGADFHSVPATRCASSQITQPCWGVGSCHDLIFD